MVWVLFLILVAGIMWVLHMRAVRYPPVHDTLTLPFVFAAVLLSAIFAFVHVLDIRFAVSLRLPLLVAFVGATIGPAVFYVLNGAYDQSSSGVREATALKVYMHSGENSGCGTPFHSSYEVVVKSWIPGLKTIHVPFSKEDLAMLRRLRGSRRTITFWTRPGRFGVEWFVRRRDIGDTKQGDRAPEERKSSRTASD